MNATYTLPQPRRHARGHHRPPTRLGALLLRVARTLLDVTVVVPSFSAHAA